MTEKKKAEKVFKTFRTVVIKADDQDEGVIDMLIPMSTASTDRHGESIDPKGWKKGLKEFKKRAVMISSHNYHGLQNQIGEYLDLQVVPEGLFARPKYYINQGNPEADWAYFLATKGMAAYSVGFIPTKWQDSDGKDGKPSRTYTEQELIEISHVIVPSNRDAIQGLQAKAEYKEYDPVVKEIIDEVLKDEDEEVIAMIKGKVKDIKPTPIDPEKVKASIDKDEKEEDEIIKENKELKEKIKDLELKAGAVLNTKNKSNLTNAQALIQSVLDSAGDKEEGMKGDKTKDTKKDDSVITITDNKIVDPPKDEKTKEKTFTVDEKVIAEAIKKSLDYALGKVSK